MAFKSFRARCQMPPHPLPMSAQYYAQCQVPELHKPPAPKQLTAGKSYREMKRRGSDPNFCSWCQKQSIALQHTERTDWLEMSVHRLLHINGL